MALLLGCSGRVVVSGMGKSGHIARKIAATLASTGTPAMFVHPAEAAHGDLGMVTAAGCLHRHLVFRRDGRTDGHPADHQAHGRAADRHDRQARQSSLALLADVHLDVSVAKEACPLNLAPTASTTVTLALGDALAVALLDARGFKEEDFARSHPGGALGRRLLTHVRDVMRSGDAVPAVTADVQPVDGAAGNHPEGHGHDRHRRRTTARPVGVFTDGDLRRMIERVQDFTKVVIRDVMHANPRRVHPDQLAVDAVAIMEEFRINQMLVVDADDKLVGALHIHDLTRAKVI